MNSLQTFITSPYTLEYFKDFIQQAFPQAQLLNSPTTPYKDGSIIHAYAPICQDIELESSHILQVFAFEVGSTHAKVTLHKELAKIAKNNASHILACFYDPSDTQEFRLSLITTGFDFEANKSTHSNLRRQSFTLGRSIPTHTAQKQLQTLIDSQAKSKQALEEAFSLEPVTKEFYKEIKEIFDTLCAKIKATHLNKQGIKEFATKLLGRTLFVRFLAELTLIPKDIFTKSLVDATANYYQDILAPLFFEVLNTPTQARAKHIADNSLFSSIPYLNGGLFAPSAMDSYQSNELGSFSAITIPNEIFSKLFGVFECYHFTIDESSPLDQEVGLDPEMLGKMFENLLAEIDPNIENNTNIRKATGSFYTPRPIVSFMCQRALSKALSLRLPHISQDSLQTLLETKDASEAKLDQKAKPQILSALNSLKILDMFCGSGAFPIGILQEILHTQVALDDTRSPYERKLSIIQNQIYGIDIQPIATEIARLRCFLSLIIESPIDKSKPNFGIAPLPNLDFKFASANSFLKLPKDEILESPDYFACKQEMQNLRDRYFQPQADKQDIQAKFLAQRAKFFDSFVMQLGEAHPLASYNPFDEMSVAGFFDSEFIFGVSDFDILISNPPYISTKGSHKSYKKELEKQYGFFDDTYNHAFFICYENLAPNGVLSLITPKTFFTIQSKDNLRKLLLDTASLDFICDSANPFEAAMVDTAITQAYKSHPKPTQTKFIDLTTTPTATYTIPIDLYKSTARNVIFKPTPQNLALHKLNTQAKPLLDRWWSKIDTSKNIAKNASALESYRASLKPGDITLLGLITDGGQGLATANNGKYVGLRQGSKEALRAEEQRAKKLYEARQTWEAIGQDFANAREAKAFLDSKSEQEVRELFDELKEKYGRDVFGQGFLYRIVSDDEIAVVESLSQSQKANGIDSVKCFVPYDKGDKDGNRWFLPTPYYIAWSKENVSYLKTHSGKKGEGMPVVRNPQFYFREGFCWNNVLHYESGQVIKCRYKGQSINDVASMSLYSMCHLPISFFVSVLNSSLLYEYLKVFVNASVNLQINDIRQLPIVIPTQEQLRELESIFNEAYRIQQEKFTKHIAESHTQSLEALQARLDSLCLSLYKL